MIWMQDDPEIHINPFHSSKKKIILELYTIIVRWSLNYWKWKIWKINFELTNNIKINTHIIIFWVKTLKARLFWKILWCCTNNRIITNNYILLKSHFYFRFLILIDGTKINYVIVFRKEFLRLVASEETKYEMISFY